MKLSAKHKITLFLAILVTAVVLCTLPFLILQKEHIYIYTQSPQISSRENGFIRELKRLGLKVTVNSQDMPSKDSYALWFKDPDYMVKIKKSEAKQNFLYTESYYPLDWKGYKKLPVILTPYRTLYEHYMRTNMKSAKMILGTNFSDYYQENNVKKLYPVVYYGDNDDATLISLLKDNVDVWFLGSFWRGNSRHIALKENSPKERHKVLVASEIVIINNSDPFKFSEKVLEATASGALVFYPAHSIMEHFYQDNLVLYKDNKDCIDKIIYYLNNPNIRLKKSSAAQKITLDKFNSSVSAKRFLQILTWLKQTNN